MPLRVAKSIKPSKTVPRSVTVIKPSTAPAKLKEKPKGIVSVTVSLKPSKSLTDNKVATVKSAIPKKKKVIQRNQALPQTLVRQIFSYIPDKDLSRSKLFCLRRLGKSWREIVDNEYLPFYHNPASAWTPYLPDRVPEDLLLLSKDKTFKSHADIQQFVDLSKVPKTRNPFPSREIKMWCTWSYIKDKDDVLLCFRNCGQYIWSFTYVLGPMPDSLRIVYSILQHLPNLEDLRLVNLDSVIKQSGYKDQEDRKLPELPQCAHLNSIALTHCYESFILDDLLTKYGRKVECLEVEGSAMQNSRYFKRAVVLPKLKKLKVNLVNEGVLDLCRKSWALTHLSLARREELSSATTIKQPVASVSLSRILEVLENYRKTLVEVHLFLGYFDKPVNMRQIDQFTTTYRKISKLGLPLEYIKLWSQWNVPDKIPGLKHLVFYDWCQWAGGRAARGDYVKNGLRNKDTLIIREAVAGAWNRCSELQTVTVLYGKSEDKPVYKDSKRFRRKSGLTVVSSRNSGETV